MKYLPLFLVLVPLLLGLDSCATMTLMPETRNATFDQTDRQANARNYVVAAQALDGPDTAKFYNQKDQVLRFLDTGMLYGYGVQEKLGIDRLENAEQLIETNYTKSVTNAAATFLLNDTAQDYFGEAYEDVYINVFKALDYIKLNQFDDAFVEIRRVNDKLNLLEDKYGKLASSMNSNPQAKGAVKAGKTEFHNSALARYLSLLLYRAEGQYDNAEIDLTNLKKAYTDQPHVYPFPLPPVDSLVVPSKAARVNVIGFIGRNPTKKAYTLRMNTGKDIIFLSEQKEDNQGNLRFTNITPIAFYGATPGLNFKCQLPQMFLRESKVRSIRVLVDGQPAGNLQLLERLDTVALETFKLTEQPTFYKTVIRTVVKGLLAKAASDQADKSLGVGGDLLGFALGLAVDASEQADLRMARYFPGQAYVGEFSVVPGEHSVSVEYLGQGGTILYTQAFPAKNYGADALNLLDSYDLE